MFSLIIAIISIALVVALVAVGAFYGGSSILEGQAQAEAARLKNEEQQIMGAVDMYRADHRTWPANVQELLDRGYLRSIPAGVSIARASAPSFIASAHAQASTLGWTPVVEGQPIYVTAVNVSQRTCQKYNLVSRGDDGILRLPYSNLLAQCYGESGSYRVVITKPASADVVSLLTALGNGNALEGGLPTADGGDAWWDTAPAGPVKAPIDPDKTPTALLSLSASTLDFGQTGVGEVSAVRLLTLTNTGNRELTGLGGYSAPAGFTLVSDTCRTGLGVKESCALELAFAPGEARAYEGTLAFHSNSASPAAVDLKGAGIQAVLVCEGPEGGACDLSMGDVGVGSSKTSGALTLRNTGTNKLSNLTIGLTGGFAATNSNCGSELAAGASCSFAVELSPEEMRDYAGQLTLGGQSIAPRQFNLVARGTQQRLESDLALAQNLGPGPALAYHYARHTFKNTGNLPVTLGAFTRTAGSGFLNAASCASGKVLQAGESCTLIIGFDPSIPAGANLSVAARLETTAGAKELTAAASTSALSWAVASGAGSVLTPNTAYPQVMRLTNTAPTTFVFGGGPVAGKFSLTQTAGTAWSYTSTTCGATLAPGAFCDVTLSVKPQSVEDTLSANLVAHGQLRDFMNRVESAEVRENVNHASYLLTAQGSRINRAADVAAMTNATYPQGVTTVLGEWYGTARGSTNWNVPGDWKLGKTVTVNGKTPVQAKLRYQHDDANTGMTVNGGPVVSMPSALSGVLESPAFTLLPGVNSVTVQYQNGGGPGSFIFEVWTADGSQKLSDSSGWRYAGAAAPVALYSSPLRYADGNYPTSCLGYRQPAAGYEVATTSGAYLLKTSGGEVFEAQCEMVAAGGGWTLSMGWANTASIDLSPISQGTGTSCNPLTSQNCLSLAYNRVKLTQSIMIDGGAGWYSGATGYASRVVFAAGSTANRTLKELFSGAAGQNIPFGGVIEVGYAGGYNSSNLPWTNGDYWWIITYGSILSAYDTDGGTMHLIGGYSWGNGCGLFSSTGGGCTAHWPTYAKVWVR